MLPFISLILIYLTICHLFNLIVIVFVPGLFCFLGLIVLIPFFVNFV